MSDRLESFRAAGVRSATVRIPAGSVTVREPEADGDAETVTVAVSGRNADGVDIQLDAGELVVAHNQQVSFGSTAHHVDITGRIAGVTVRTASADVRIAQSSADVHVETASGDVATGATSGAVDVRTASGDIAIGSTAERVRVRTSSGDVRIEAANAGGSVTSASGDVRIGTGGDSLALKTASGQIDVTRFDGQVLSAKTISADVRIGVPAGRTLQVDLQTLSGDMRLPSEPGAEARADGGARIRPEGEDSVRRCCRRGDRR